MEASLWPTVWAAVIIATLIVFGGLAITVGIRGLADVRAMFRSLSRQHEREEERQEERL